MKEVSVFYKPTQMLSIGKGKLKRIHWEGMNILLKKAQDIIYYNTLVGTGAIKNNEYTVLSCGDLALKTHYISVEEFISSTSQSLRLKDLKAVIELLDELCSLNLKLVDSDKITFANVFQKVIYNKGRKRIEFQISNDITTSFSKGTTLLSENGVTDSVKFSQVPIYTEAMKNLVYGETGVKFTDYEFIVYEIIMEFINMANSNKFTESRPFKKSYSIKGFRSILGIKETSYSSPSVFKTKVLTPIEKTMEKLGIFIEFNIIGRGKEASEVDLVIKKNSKAPNFVKSNSEIKKEIKALTSAVVDNESKVKYKEENSKVTTKIKSKTPTQYKQSILDKDKKELYKYLSNCGRERELYEELISTTEYKFYKECLKINGLNFASEKAFLDGLRYWDSERIIRTLISETKELED